MFDVGAAEAETGTQFLSRETQANIYRALEGKSSGATVKDHPSQLDRKRVGSRLHDGWAAFGPSIVSSLNYATPGAVAGVFFVRTLAYQGSAERQTATD